jgi:hypothetical protein
MYAVNTPIMAPVARFLPPDAMSVFLTAANSAMIDGGDHNDCIKAGWDAVKAEGWSRPETGKRWVRKDNPSPEDVHVNQPIGKPKPKKMPRKYGEGDMQKFEVGAQVCKVDAKLGLVFGFAIVCKIDGEPYWDLQKDDDGNDRPDHIPEDAMLKAITDFMQAERISTEMHARDSDGAPVPDGGIVFAFPLTTEIAKALEIESRRTGLLIGMKPSGPVLEKYKSGEYQGFSIGGFRLEDEELDDAA